MPMAHVPSRVRKKVEWLLHRAEGALLPERTRGEEGAHLDPPGALAKLAAEGADVARVDVEARVDQLREALSGGAGGDEARRKYVEQHGVAGVQRFHSKSGTRIYAMAVET